VYDVVKVVFIFMFGGVLVLMVLNLVWGVFFDWIVFCIGWCLFWVFGGLVGGVVVMLVFL